MYCSFFSLYYSFGWYDFERRDYYHILKTVLNQTQCNDSLDYYCFYVNCCRVLKEPRTSTLIQAMAQSCKRCFNRWRFTCFTCSLIYLLFKRFCIITFRNWNCFQVLTFKRSLFKRSSSYNLGTLNVYRFCYEWLFLKS